MREPQKEEEGGEGDINWAIAGDGRIEERKWAIMELPEKIFS